MAGINPITVHNAAGAIIITDGAGGVVFGACNSPLFVSVNQPVAPVVGTLTVGITREPDARYVVFGLARDNGTGVVLFATGSGNQNLFTLLVTNEAGAPTDLVADAVTIQIILSHE